MKTSELVSLAAMAVTAVMAVMVGLPLAAAKLNLNPCKQGEYLDHAVNECTDCAVACHAPNSPDCVELCPGVLQTPDHPSPESPAQGWNVSLLLALTLVPSAIVIIVLVAGILYRVRQQEQHRDPENGEQDRLREGQVDEGGGLRDNDDGDLHEDGEDIENRDGEGGIPEEEHGDASLEEANIGHSEMVAA